MYFVFSFVVLVAGCSASQQGNQITAKESKVNVRTIGNSSAPDWPADTKFTPDSVIFESLVKADRVVLSCTPNKDKPAPIFVITTFCNSLAVQELKNLAVKGVNVKGGIDKDSFGEASLFLKSVPFSQAMNMAMGREYLIED